MSEMAQKSIGSASIRRTRWLRPKYLLFAGIGLMAAYVLRNNESFLINPKDPEWQHIASFRWWLLPHGLAGASALFLGPLQFSDRLRQRYTKLHRVLGRFYVGAALIAGPLGIYIQYFEERMGFTRSFSVAAAFDAILWIVTTSIALAFILKGKVQQHRQWMTRSFAVAPLIFLEARLISGITGWNPEIVVWGCVSASVLMADIIIQLQELYRTQPVPVRTRIVKPVLETAFMDAVPDVQE
jgi:uncharacterized membrane protein